MSQGSWHVVNMFGTKRIVFHHIIDVTWPWTAWTEPMKLIAVSFFSISNLQIFWILNKQIFADVKGRLKSAPRNRWASVDSFYFQYRNCTALNFERYRGAIVVHVLIVHFCCETFVSFINSAISFEGLFFVRQVQFWVNGKLIFYVFLSDKIPCNLLNFYSKFAS